MKQHYLQALKEAGIEKNTDGIEVSDAMSLAELKALAAHHRVTLDKSEEVEVAEESATEKPKLMRVKVLVPRLTIRTGVAARGARINLKEDDAKYHHGAGNVAILGYR